VVRSQGPNGERFHTAETVEGRIVRIRDHDERPAVPGPPGPRLTGRTGISLASTDLGRTIAFYRERLGFVVTGCWPGATAPTWCELSRDGAQLMFFLADGGQSPALTGVVYLTVEGVDALARELAERGAVFAWGPETMSYGMREVAVRDPDGYLVGFWEPARE
jgi:predicted enzyme related to lactoylglutathione lyase